MTMPASRKRHLAMLERGLIFCHFGRRDDGQFTAWLWHEGGAVDGCHQPRTWVEGFQSHNEATVRAWVESAWPGVIYRQVRPYDTELMRVTVVDRKAMDATYGTPSFQGVVTRSVQIRKACAVCGELRGYPTQSRFHEWGEFYVVDTWTNDCGHVDKYADVLREARMISDGEL